MGKLTGLPFPVKGKPVMHIGWICQAQVWLGYIGTMCGAREQSLALIAGKGKPVKSMSWVWLVEVWLGCTGAMCKARNSHCLERQAGEEHEVDMPDSSVAWIDRSK